MEVNEYISNNVQNYEKLILSEAWLLGSMSAVHTKFVSFLVDFWCFAGSRQ